MQRRPTTTGTAGMRRRAGRLRLFSGCWIAGLAAISGCVGQSQNYPGIPQPAYSQAEYFQPGHEEELKAEAARLRQAAQLPPYEEGTASATR